MIPVEYAPRVIFASPKIFNENQKVNQWEESPPKGWPSFARAAPLTNTGIDDLCPRMVVDGSHRDTTRKTRGWKKKRLKALSFS